MGAICARNLETLARERGVIIRCHVSGHAVPDTLWFEVPSDYANFLETQRADWVCAALLMPAMLRGQDLVVESSVSERLLYHLSGDLQHVLRCQNSRLNRIAVRSADTWKAGDFRTGEAVGTGFSAGIDSLSTVIDSIGQKMPRSHEVTHLVTLDVGGFPRDDVNRSFFRHGVSRAERFARKFNLRHVTIRSNLADFYDGLEFQGSATVRNMAAILVLQKLFRRYLYSSTLEYSQTYIGPSHSMSISDPTILNLLSTENTDLLTYGSQYTRLEKTRIVSSYPFTYDELDVCVASAATRKARGTTNCSDCWKCRRTLLTLDLIGCLERYGNVFDLNHYRRNRARHIGDVLAAGFKNGQANDREAIGLLIEKYQLRWLLNGRFLPFLRWLPTRSVQFYGRLVGYSLAYRERPRANVWSKVKQYVRSAGAFSR